MEFPESLNFLVKGVLILPKTNDWNLHYGSFPADFAQTEPKEPRSIEQNKTVKKRIGIGGGGQLQCGSKQTWHFWKLTFLTNRTV